jgi:hypothetical protein
MDIILPIGALAIPIAVLVALGFGVRLIRQGNQEITAEREQALRWAGGNLSEPAINVFVVFGLMLVFLNQYAKRYVDLSYSSTAGPLWDLTPQAMLVTLPILILLKPLRGWNSSDEPSRDLNRALVGIGALRWAATVFSLIYPPAVLLGLVVLMISLMVILNLADAVVNPDPVRGIAVGLGPEGVRVAPVGDFSRDDQPGITF